jgi:hypothetical protein
MACPELVGRETGTLRVWTAATAADRGTGRGAGRAVPALAGTAPTDAAGFLVEATFVTPFFVGAAFFGAGFAAFRFGAAFTRDGIFFLRLAGSGRDAIFYDAN